MTGQFYLKKIKIHSLGLGPGTGQSPGHFYLKNIEIHSPCHYIGPGQSPGRFYLKNIEIHSPSHDIGPGKSPGQGPGYSLRTVVSRSSIGSVPFSVPGTEVLL